MPKFSLVNSRVRIPTSVIADVLNHHTEGGYTSLQITKMHREGKLHLDKGGGDKGRITMRLGDLMRMINSGEFPPAPKRRARRGQTC